MTIEITMPAISPTMESGTLARWLVAEGDRIIPGTILAEIETDKATMEVEAVDEGWIASLIIAAGTDDVAVGTVIASMTETAPARVPDAEREARTSEIEPEIDFGGGETAQVQPVAAAAPSEDAEPTAKPSCRKDASALALRIARARRLDLDAVSGANGRVKLRDLMPIRDGVAPDDQWSVARASADQSGLLSSKPSESPEVPQRSVSSSVEELAASAPGITLTTEIRVDRLLRFTGELNEALIGRGLEISLNDMLLKATATMLARVSRQPADPTKGPLDAGSPISVATRESSMMKMIVVPGADRLSLSGIAKITSQPSRSSAHDRPMWSDGDDTPIVASIEDAGINHAIVHRSSASIILTVGAVRRRSREIDGAIQMVPVVGASATFRDDQWQLAKAAEVLSGVKALLEQPYDLAV